MKLRTQLCCTGMQSAGWHAAWENISVFFLSFIKTTGWVKSSNEHDSRIYLHRVKMFSFTASEHIEETKALMNSEERKKRHWCETPNTTMLQRYLLQRFICLHLSDNKHKTETRKNDELHTSTLPPSVHLARRLQWGFVQNSELFQQELWNGKNNFVA